MPRCDCWAHRALIPKRTRRARAVVINVEGADLAKVIADAARPAEVVEPEAAPAQPDGEPTDADTTDEDGS